MTEMNNIEELMRTYLKDAEQAAPEGAWDEIAQRMAANGQATNRYKGRKAWIAAGAATVLLVAAAIILYSPATGTPAAVPDSPEVASLHTPEPVAQPIVAETVEEKAPATKQPIAVALAAKTEPLPQESIPNVSTNAVAATPAAVAAPEEDIENLLMPEAVEEEKDEQPVVSTPKQAPKQQAAVAESTAVEQEKPQSQPKEKKEEIYIPIPNILTPNGDGYNDCWVIPDLEQYGKAQVQIFTAHSQRVFYTGNYRNDFCGAGLPNGDYFYIIVFRDLNITRRGVLVIQH